MAAPILLFERRAAVLKVEVTYGTDPTPTGAANSLQVIEGKLSYQADKLERNIDTPYIGAKPFTLIKKRGMFEADIELCGAAAPGSGTPLDAALRACSHALVSVPATSDTFNPVSASFASSTLYFEHAGLLYKLTGCRGSIEITMDIDAYPKAKLRLMGLILAATPTEASIAGFTLSAFQKPVVIEKETWAVTFNATALNTKSLTLMQGQDPQLYHGSEIREISYNKRGASGRILVFQDTLATFNPWALAEAHTDVAIVSTLTGGAGKNFALNIPKAQFELPTQVSIDGAAGWEIPYVAKPNSASGNDEYTLGFS